MDPQRRSGDCNIPHPTRIRTLASFCRPTRSQYLFRLSYRAPTFFLHALLIRRRVCLFPVRALCRLVPDSNSSSNLDSCSASRRENHQSRSCSRRDAERRGAALRRTTIYPVRCCREESWSNSSRAVINSRSDKRLSGASWKCF